MCAALASLPILASTPEELTPVRAFRSFEKRATDGLPQSTVDALYQDDEGVLWIATLDGLATFDGAALRAIAKEPGAPASGPVLALARRHAGGVHAGTNLGIHSFDGSGWTLSPTRRPALSVAEAEDGALWVVEPTGGVLRKGKSSAMWESIPLPDLKGAVAVSARTGPLFLAGRGGVVKIAGTRAEPIAGGAAPPSPITALLPASSGAIWIGTMAGELLFARPGDVSWSSPEHAPWGSGPGAGRAHADADPGWIRSLAEDRRGRVWAGGKDGRVTFGSEKGAWSNWSHRNGLKRSAITALLGDREGTVWLGFNGNGLQQWLGEAWSHRNRWSDEPDGFRTQVFGVTPTLDGGVLAAVFSLGVWRWDGGTLHRYGREDGLTEDVRIAVEPERGVLWVGGRFGIFESIGGKPFTRSLTLPSGFVTGFFATPGGEWLASTSTAGLYRLRGKTWEPHAGMNAALPHLNVRDVVFRADETWVATSGGVTVFSRGAVTQLPPSHPNGVPEAPNCILVRPSGEVWIGGFGGIGIRGAGGARFLGPEQGTPGGTVYSLAEGPGGTLWAGGSMGAARLENGRWKSFSTRNGLLDDECNLHGLLVLPTGEALVGTMGSLARFAPDVAPLAPPPLRCFVREPRAAVGRAHTLARGSRLLRVTWSAPWLSAEPLEFRERILPLESNWSRPQAKSELVVENLGPGRFDIEVAARVAGTETWSRPASVRVVVEPWPWQTPAAKVAGVLLVALAGAALYRARTRRLAARTAWLDAEVAKRTAELEASNRELTEAKQALAELARRDPLTGLHNRRAADERLEELVAERRRYPSAFAVLVFDVDEFKSINDQHGHEAGDLVLKHVGELCLRTLRGADFVARYGGDEFLVIYSRASEDAATKAAERLRHELETSSVAIGQNLQIRVTLSGGIGAARAEEPVSLGEVLAAADRALYDAKRGGRNRVGASSARSAGSGRGTAA